ncbi:hypothetical protein F5B19DRAFT_213348 [Rostrohypoxylon terebratum]|nr:hypothetical protein F5B19DRAFT_213348 [Rostrohypoxylon terebratum]
MTANIYEQSLLGEKAGLPFTQPTQRRRHIAKNMPSARNFFLTLLLGLLVTAGLANAFLKQQLPNEEQTEGESGDVTHRDDSTFSRLLNSASPQAIHHFLHAYFPATYKHGVYDSDHAAMEVVHANDPELATSIVQLAKRQQSSSSNDTTAAVTSSTSTETSVSSAATPTSESSTTQESTTEATSATPSSTSTSNTPTSSTATPTSSAQTESQTTTTTSESSETTSTSDSTLATATTSSASTTASPRTSTFTSTLPGGAKTTITSVEVVTPGATEAASTTSGTSGSLQSGVGRALAVNPMVEVIIGVIVGGALLA